ncbi:hypothetical protein [Kitasatospora sp. A2-31]|uniref:hypothetical protein n=1 Tax=Kitasatospora sp. A2-31 TaxID=2916414 RepID=UPI001EEE6FB3|nr:hypothetical protein [Kitasatospora sp. A2-31]MCG6499445.1 hypothetical protein [Kitasatospora sp. A2-31]
MSYLASAIDTAAKYQLAAPEQAPNAGLTGMAGGAFIVGVIAAAVLITKWRTKGLMTPQEKKHIAIAALAIICLAGSGGVLGGLISTVHDTANQTGTTLQQTSVGR